MKKDRTREIFLEQLRKLPIIQVGCEKAGIARSTAYRWMDEDPEFAKKVDKALEDGGGFMNDLTESQLIVLIKERNFPAISLWLRTRHPKFKPRLDLTATFQPPQEELTPEQEAVVREALRLASSVETNSTKQENETNNSDSQPGGVSAGERAKSKSDESQKSDTAKGSGCDDKGQESAGGDR